MSCIHESERKDIISLGISGAARQDCPVCNARVKMFWLHLEFVDRHFKSEGAKKYVDLAEGEFVRALSGIKSSDLFRS